MLVLDYLRFSMFLFLCVEISVFVLALLFVSLPSDDAEEQPVGRVSNLRVVESLGSTVRLGWTGVAGATQYRIIILNTEGALILLIIIIFFPQQFLLCI